MDTTLKYADIISNSGATDAGMNLDLHVITKGNYNLLNLLSKLTRRSEDERLAFTKLRIKLGEGTNRKGGSFTL